MPFVPAQHAHVVCSLRHTLVLRPAAVTWGASHSGVASQALANSIVDSFFDAVVARMDNAVTIGPATVYFGSATGATLPFSVTASGPGTRNMSSISSNVAALVRKFTNIPGRKGRGRMFIPWSVPETNVDEIGQITGGTEIADWNTALAAWIADATTEGQPLVLLHNDNGATAPSPITSMVLDPVVGTQRRRLRR